MVTRDTAWPPGTPCWADLSADDLGRARAFYSGLLGWNIPPGPAEMGGYSIADVAGRAVAGIGPKMGAPDAPVAWTTHLATDDADGSAARITAAGGQLLMEPFDVMDIGRMAIAADPAGAVFGLWQSLSFTGAQLTRSGTRGRVTERRVVLNQDGVTVIDSQWTILVATRPPAGE